VLGIVPVCVGQLHLPGCLEGKAVNFELDRSSRPHLSASQLAPSVEAEIETLRLRRLSGPKITPRRGVVAERLFNQPPQSRIATATIAVQSSGIVGSKRAADSS
jgi:hypothetical protein